MFTTRFWEATAERAAKSAAQALIGLWTLDAGFNILHADLTLAAGIAAGAATLSVLTSILSAGVAEPDSPSLLTAQR